MMHLLKQLNGPNGLLDFINTGVTGDLTFLAPYKTQLTVSCACLCVEVYVSAAMCVCGYE